MEIYNYQINNVKKSIEHLKTDNEKIDYLIIELLKARYYGSDLNREISENLNFRRDMTVNNIDLIQYSKYQNLCRIVESKHKNECIKYGQGKLLSYLNKEFKYKNVNIKLYVVYANKPYNELIICDADNKHIVTLKDQEVIDWLNFKFEIN